MRYINLRLTYLLTGTYGSTAGLIHLTTYNVRTVGHDCV